MHGNNADSFYHDKNSAAIVVHNVLERTSTCVCVHDYSLFLVLAPLIMVDFGIEFVEKRSSKYLS